MNLNNLNPALMASFKSFRDNPYNYLCEFDIHAELFTLLRKKLTDLQIDIDYKYNKIKIYKEQHCTFSLVRNEYYVDNKRLDIAILNKDEFKSDEFEVNGNPLYSEEVDIGIEIKFNAFNSEYSSINDINKLLDLLDKDKINTGISFLFSHKEIKYEKYPRIMGMDSENIVLDCDNTINIKEKYVYSFIITPDDIKCRRFQ